MRQAASARRRRLWPPPRDIASSSPISNSDRAAAAAGRIGGGSWPIKLDIRSEDGWTAALDEAWRREGQLDVLINNAAIVHTGWARDVSLGGHRNTMETNFFGAVIGMMTALPRMKAQGHGHLISISSMNAFIPYPGIASYAAAKHALRAFHAALALEERESAVNFTLVYPTATETPMLEKESRGRCPGTRLLGNADTGEHRGEGSRRVHDDEACRDIHSCRTG